jgi:prepilin-type N-terminal cleavage/methylation domain-containing protein
MRPAQRNIVPAFTLLELLVALAMAGIIAASLYSGLRIGFRARASAETAVEPIRTAELGTALLRADFESALPARGTLAGPFVGLDSTGGAGLPADAVEFFTLGNPTDLLAAPPTGVAAGPAAMIGGATALAATGEARKVQIGLAAHSGAGGEQVLVRRVTTNLLSPVEVEPHEEVLCRGVRSLNIRYYDGLTWQDTWDSTQAENNIPSAVELTLELDRSTPDQPKIIRFPRVFLLSCSTLAPQTGLAADAGGATP